MKRTYSKATLYRKVKRGITICKDLSQDDYDCCLDCCNLSPTINNKIFESHVTNAENVEEIQSEIDVFNSHFDNSSCQSCDNVSNTSDCEKFIG